ncbi:Glucosamine/galactosamine-6-phosphate isomerase [Candidatus Sulfotelmatobacter kueseliae]|uniref:Glucosamine/galactosamine-6-phosphate isomerase n=1 Tax=Candidatus Sulfotelmatobacter kueseliae TaxID=2042962 RepID=A0A2U3L746_9BACT|nr:Glucosamine/galactosamine-6-phosphate isomerase [Candidatus Sulfotelmatobacter kueseliae]
MNVRVFSDKYQLAAAAAQQATTALGRAIREHGRARIIAATGASQFEFLEELTKTPDVDWKRVEMFHLDEYVGLPATHPASFRKYLLDRLINRVGIARYHLMNGEVDPRQAIAEVTAEIRQAPIDVAFVGIGENGHLAFNDPPADFESEAAYIVVDLDEPCRRQQLGEGWFKSLADVPCRAISMTVRQILKSREIVCVVPDARKAQAVAKCLQGEISPMAPASILRTHPNTIIYLDRDSSALLPPEVIAALQA